MAANHLLKHYAMPLTPKGFHMRPTELPSGIPETDEYSNLVKTELFREMEAFSDAFLVRNRSHLAEYARKWVSDPLHNWSRQWEYPYAFGRIAAEALARGTEELCILDAGSGATFMPHFIRSCFEKSEVHCCDRDGSLEETHALINQQERQAVKFSVSPLDATRFPNDHFDCIYCVSVLEHTDNRCEIMDEFRRILKPGGLLVVTFDISIDGAGDIPPTDANQLLLEMESRYAVEGQIRGNMSALLGNPNIVTTTGAWKVNPALLPWKHAPSPWIQIKSFLRHGRKVVFPPPYTVYCLSMRKRRL